MRSQSLCTLATSPGRSPRLTCCQQRWCVSGFCGCCPGSPKPPCCWHGRECSVLLLRAGSEGIRGKTFLLCLLPSGLPGPKISQLGCASPAPVAVVTPTAGCASGLAWLPLPCCWHQADLFFLPLLLPAWVCLEGDVVLPGIWPPLPHCPCLAGPCSIGLASRSTGLHAARTPDKHLAGSYPRMCWQSCAFTWG